MTDDDEISSDWTFGEVELARETAGRVALASMFILAVLIAAGVWLLVSGDVENRLCAVPDAASADVLKECQQHRERDQSFLGDRTAALEWVAWALLATIVSPLVSLVAVGAASLAEGQSAWIVRWGGIVAWTTLTAAALLGSVVVVRCLAAFRDVSDFAGRAVG